MKEGQVDPNVQRGNEKRENLRNGDDSSHVDTLN